MQPFRRRHAARSVFSVLTALGLLLGIVGTFWTPPVAAQTASIIVNNHTCDVDISGMDIYEMAAACQSQGIGWQVAAEYQTVGDPAANTSYATTDGAGLASFGGLSLGTYYLSLQQQGDYIGFYAFCKVDDYLGNAKYPMYFPQLQPQIIDVQLDADGDMGYCDFFSYKAAAQPTTGDVIVNKITCPPGYNGYEGDIYDLALNCQDATQVVSFDLVDSNGGQSSETTPGQVANLAQWGGVPSGPLSITETSGSYYQPRVFCKNEKYTGESDPELEVDVQGTTASAELKDGWDLLYCDWFNIQYEPGYATIIINKHVCPEDYLSDSQYDLAQNCQEPYDPIEFKLDGASSGNPGTQYTGDVIPNGVQWSNLDSDTWYISEFPPDGYGEPIVFCKRISNDDGSESSQEQVPVEQTDDAYRIVQDVAEMYTLWCDWYNVSATPYVGIYVHKYGCPEAYQDNWSLQEWGQYCTTIVRDAKFTVEAENGDSFPQNLSGIDIWWEFLAPGKYKISEEAPPSWNSSVVYCAIGSYTASTGEYKKVDIENGGFSWDLFDYEYLDCYWFNLPKPRPVVTIDPNAPATLTIVKYTCPVNYDPLASDSDPLDDCDELTDGIEFAVIGNGNQSIKGKTGDDGEGTVTFDGLKAGSYLLRETYPEDTENAFIWSCDSDYRLFDYPFTPFARIDHTGTIKISMIAGETLECSWYNVPTPPKDEEDEPVDGEVAVTFNVFDCGGGTLNPSNCDPVGQGVGVSLSEVSGEGGPIDFETDEDGVAQGSVEPGEYDIDADDAVCIADSEKITDDGTLDLTDGEPAEVDIYLCG